MVNAYSGRSLNSIGFIATALIKWITKQRITNLSVALASSAVS